MSQLSLIMPRLSDFKKMHSKTISVMEIGNNKVSKNHSNKDSNITTVKIEIQEEHNNLVTNFYKILNLNLWNGSYDAKKQIVQDDIIIKRIEQYIKYLNNSEVAILSTYLCYSSGTQNAAIVELVDTMLDKQQLNGLTILNIFVEKLIGRLSSIQINKLNSINTDQYKLEKSFIALLTNIHQLIANVTRLGSMKNGAAKEQELKQQFDSMVEDGRNYRALLKCDTQYYMESDSQSPVAIGFAKGYIKNYVQKHHKSSFTIGFAEGYIKNSSPLSRDLALEGNPEHSNEEIMLYNNAFRVAIASFFSAARESNIQLVDSTLNQLILIHKKYCLHILKQYSQSGRSLLSTDAKFIKKFLGLKRGNTLVNFLNSMLRRDTRSLAKFKKLQLTNGHESDKENTQQIYKQLKEEHHLPLRNIAEVKTVYKVFLEYKDYEGLAEYLELLSNKIKQSCDDKFKYQISQIISLVFKNNGLKAGILDHLNTIKQISEAAQLPGFERCITMAQELLQHHKDYNDLIKYEYSDFIVLLSQKTFSSKQSFLQASTIIAYAIDKNDKLSLQQKNSLCNFMIKQLDNQENQNFTMLHKKRSKFISTIGISAASNGCSNLKYDTLAVDNSISHNNNAFSLEPKVANYGLSQLISTLLSGLLPNYYNVSETFTSRSVKRIWSNYLGSKHVLNQDEISQNTISQDKISSGDPFEVLQHKIKDRLNNNQINKLIYELEDFDNKVLLYSVLTIKFNNYCPLEQMLLKAQKHAKLNGLLALFLISAQAYSVTENALKIGDNKNIIDCEKWPIDKFFNYVAKIKPQNSHSSLVESVLILAMIEGDTDSLRQLTKRRHFSGIINRLVDNQVSHFKPLRQNPLQKSLRNRTIFRVLVATLATIAGVLLVASGVGTPAVMGIFLIMGICKSILNSMSETLDYGNTPEYKCIQKLLGNEDIIGVNTGESERIRRRGDEYLSNWMEVLGMSASVIDIISAPCEVKEALGIVISEARFYGRMMEQENLAPKNKSASSTKNHSATYHSIKQVLKLANESGLSQKNILQENIKKILADYFKDDLSCFTQLDMEYLSRINAIQLPANYIFVTEIESELDKIFLEIQNQVVDKYTATQAIFRWAAILYSSHLPNEHKSNQLKKILEQFKQQEHPLAKVLLQHKNISGKRKYFIYDIVIGAATGFIDMVGLHVFDFSSVGQMAISGAASSINKLVELSRQKDTQKIKTQSFKNAIAFLEQMVLLKDSINELSIMEA